MNVNTKQSTAGFSLIEVMVALALISIGLLGIAKMQALALSTTGSSSSRALAAMEASGLASTMHADRAYWSAGLAPATVTIQGGTITSANPSDPTLSTPVLCTAASGNPLPYCAANQVAAYDLQSWANSLQAILPEANSTINCLTNTLPISCTIVIQWSENTVAINTQQQSTMTATRARAMVRMVGAGGGSAAFNQASYTLFVEP